jgi:hypothetical protein
MAARSTLYITIPTKKRKRGHYMLPSTTEAQASGTQSSPSNSPSHRLEISERSMYLDITAKTRIVTREEVHTDHTHEYKSKISSASFKLPRHMQCLTGLIPEFVTPHVYQEDWDLIATVHDLLDNWCSDMNIKCNWVKGHVDLLNRPLS